MDFRVQPVRLATDFEATARLFDEYASSLEIDLSYQDFATERATLPGQYAAPAGELLLARSLQRVPLGCVALRPIAPAGSCEMKRLYVSPRGRRLGLGRALLDGIIREARRIGYREMRLDSLPTMFEAIALYRKAGFLPIEPYYKTPVLGTVFLGLPLVG